MSRKKYGKNLYLIGDENDRVKIGSANDVQKRLRQLQTGNPDKLKIIAEFEDAGYQEPFIQKLRKESRISGEWFKLAKKSLTRLIRLLINRSEQANRKYYVNDEEDL